MNKKILFVDDESNVLDGLQRVLRPLRGDWDMLFANSGKEALETLAKQPFDVIVTDLRMPGMSGAELLAEVRQCYPQIVRIIMSGTIDQDLILKSVVPTHQFLSKPCEAETIKATVGRACALRELLADNSLQRIVSHMQSLPSLPSLYFKLVEELRSPNSSMKKIGWIISQDLGMTAKILQMVNSAFFGIRRQITSPTEAVGLLGLDTVVAMILTIQVFSQFKQDNLPSFSPTALWNHSLRVGQNAKRIAQAEGQPSGVIQDTFTAGLLHDAGKLVLAANLPQRYDQMLKLTRDERFSSHEAELEVFGTTHSAVGAYLLGLWGLPDSIVEAVAFHNRPWYCLAEGFGPLTAVHVANALAGEMEAQNMEMCDGELDLDYLTKFKLTESLPRWREICAQAISGNEEAA